LLTTNYGPSSPIKVDLRPPARATLPVATLTTSTGPEGFCSETVPPLALTSIVTVTFISCGAYANEDIASARELTFPAAPLGMPLIASAREPIDDDAVPEAA
jgi:hypothetical protein